ncbi:hypothetical protein RRG08_058335 [Elysia crispata]|uniref:Uncharacterized protein n=1 Tax=Elysia crispata TaxID=231223 RepID=A0AAE1EAB6_9GAST|nr:hypothetical protein RRG08_058335 [Elysia crispata]
MRQNYQDAFTLKPVVRVREKREETIFPSCSSTMGCAMKDGDSWTRLEDACSANRFRDIKSNAYRSFQYFFRPRGDHLADVSSLFLASKFSS